MQDGSIDVATEAAVAIVTIANPAARNALTMPMRDRLVEAMRRLMADEAVKAIILTGQGGHFCAGADIGDMASATGLGVRARLADLQELVRRIVTGPKPVIAAVEGHAAGAGLSVASCCDIVVASQGAKFTAAFNRIGLVADLGAIWTLPLRMGYGRSRYLLLTGSTIDAAQAERWGLAEIVTPDGGVLEEAKRIATEIASRAPLSHESTKSILSRMPGELETILAAERDAQAILFDSRDRIEGVTAFTEKRPPRFVGA